MISQGKQNEQETPDGQTDGVFTMRQATKILGAPAQRLRRYCRQGLIAGSRAPLLGREYTFTATQIEALRRAHFLTLAGFTVSEIRRFMFLSRHNTAKSAQERRGLLGTHKRQVWRQIEDLQQVIDFLERLEDEIV